MATYVSSVHIQQSNRVRNHLQRCRDQFLTYNYIDGSGFNRSAYPIWVNLCLITSKVRPAFMIQWVDFLDSQDYENILHLLRKYRDSLHRDDLDYRLYFITDSQGIIVTTYYTYFKRDLKHLHDEYLETTGGSREILLGRILGYPSAGENILTRDEERYIDRGLQPPGRYSFNVYVKIPGLTSDQIIGMIYRSSESREKLYSFSNRIRNALKVYDPEAQVKILDDQGSLVSDSETYFPEERLSIEISEMMEQKYQEFINSSDRIYENWNDEFDHIFTMGYRYHH
jgi:hypothetical protein